MKRIFILVLTAVIVHMASAVTPNLLPTAQTQTTAIEIEAESFVHTKGTMQGDPNTLYWIVTLQTTGQIQLTLAWPAAEHDFYGTFTTEDFLLSACIGIDFTTMVPLMPASINLTISGSDQEGTTLDCTFTEQFMGNVYHITAYEEPIPTEFEEVNFKATNLARSFNNAECTMYYFEANDEEKTIRLMIDGVDNKEYVEGRFSAGFVAANGQPEVWNVYKASLVLDKQADMVTIKGWVKTREGMQYNLDLSGNHLYNDMQLGEGIDATYDPANDPNIITELTANGEDKSWLFSLQSAPSKLELVFNVSEIGAKLPAGEYPINTTGAPMTVEASAGLKHNAYPTPSWFGEPNDMGYCEVVYMLVAGTVKVDYIGEEMRIVVDAHNSYDLPIHIEYGSTLHSAINQVEDQEQVTKYIGADGQLYIRRGNHTYTATGICVE